jgi:hypothetical protein
MTIRELIKKVSNMYKEMTSYNNNHYLEALKEELKNLDLPELTGSQKQIAWAEDIRRKALEEALHNLCWAEKFKTYGRKKFTDNTYKAIEITRERQITRIEAVAAQTSSKWWIDGRYFFREIHTYTDPETEYTLKYDLNSIARYTQKQLDKLELAKQTGEAQVIVRDSAQGIVFKITPNGEVIKEAI